MESEALNKLETRTRLVAELIEKLRSEKADLVNEVSAIDAKLVDEREKTQSIETEVNRLRDDKDHLTEHSSQRESLIKSKLEAIIEKLSILEPRGNR